MMIFLTTIILQETLVACLFSILFCELYCTLSLRVQFLFYGITQAVSTDVEAGHSGRDSFFHGIHNLIRPFKVENL